MPQLLSSTLSRMTLAGILGLAVGLGACRRDDPAQAAIRAAADRMGALTADGARITPADSMRRAGFQQVLDAVKSYRDAPNAGQAGAANVIASRALMGIAEIDGAAAAEHARRALDRQAIIRASLNVYTERSTSADAAAAYDPAPAVASLDGQLKALDAAASKAAADKAVAERQRADLMARARTMLDESQRLRDQAAVLRRQVADTTAVRGLELMEQSAKLSRQADDLDKQASYLQADADQHKPAIESLQREIDSIATQKTLVSGRRSEVLKRADLSKTIAAEGRAAAAEAAATIARLIGELAAFRAGDLAQSQQRTMTGYRESLNAAKKALAGGSGDRASAQLNIGAANQSIGDLLADQWRGHQAYAAMLMLLAESKPALPDAAKYQADAKAATDAADASLKEAKEAYTAAIDAFSGASVKNEDVKTRIDRIKEILKNLSEGNYAMTRGRPSAVAAAPASSDASSPAAAPAGDAEAQIRAMLDQFHETLRKGEIAELARFMKADSADATASIQSMMSFAKAATDLDKACQSKFGKKFADIISSGPMGQATAGLNQMSGAFDKSFSRTGADYVITIRTPVSATAVPKDGGAGEMFGELIQDGGKWYIHIKGSDLAGMAQVMPILQPLTEVFASLSKDVNSGKIGSEQALNAALTQRLAPMLMRMQQQQGGPGAPRPTPGGG